MINNYLVEQIKGNFLYKPTLEQENAVKIIAGFLFSTSPISVLLLKGYAGTGKTSLISAVVKTLEQTKQKTILLAPTGRAAKILSYYSNHQSYTIHKKIYRQDSFSNDLDNFNLNVNLLSNTIFIVDEASMISNDSLCGNCFGSGRLLEDLIKYIYNGKNCRLILIGDDAQLPPIGEYYSPALSNITLEEYGLNVTEITLTDVVRQMHESGILYNATKLRELIKQEEFYEFPKIRFSNFKEIKKINGSDLIEKISDCYGKDGNEETIVICRSNKRASIYNRGIRNSILYREDELNNGDVVMIAKNNYFWSKDCKEIDFIANGDIGIVRRVRNITEMYGLRFANVTITFPDYDNIELDTKVILDTLHSDTPSLSKEQNDKLFYSIMEDYSDITAKKEKLKRIKEDEYYNALQIKYAYAITGHKAQGGQWKNVFIDQGYMTEENLTPDYFRWLYTAITRATDMLFLVNWREEQTELS